MHKVKQVSAISRRRTKIRKRIAESENVRLSVYRTSKHIYAQLFSSDGKTTIASASTLEKDIKSTINGSTSNIKAATVIGKAIAERAAAKGVTDGISFDRGGRKYHGVVKALADAAREHGLKF